MFVPLREKTDRTALELCKSLCGKVLRNSSTESIVTKRVALGEPFRIGSNLSQSGKHKKPRRGSRLFSYKSRVFLGFQRSEPLCRVSVPSGATSRNSRFPLGTPSRIAKSLGLSRLTAAGWLTELGSVESLLVAFSREFEITRATRLVSQSRSGASSVGRFAAC